MSKNVLQDQASSPTKDKPSEPSYEEQMIWRQRWVFTGIYLIVYIGSFTSGLISYWLTKDWHCLLLASPTILMPMLVRLLPLDERRFDLKMAKIKTDKRTKKLEERICILEEKLKKYQ